MGRIAPVSIEESLSRLADAASLKKDGRRISLEGVITGSALGILLLYLLEDVQAAAARRPGGGPLDDPGASEPGRMADVAGGLAFRARVCLAGGRPRADTGEAEGAGRGVGGDRCAPRPLDALDVEESAARPLGAGSSDALPMPPPGTQASGPALPEVRPSQLAASRQDVFTSQPVSLSGGVDRGEPGPFPGATALVPEPQPEPSPVTPVIPLQPLPQLMLVVVRGYAGSSSRTVEGVATSEQEARQVGVENSVLDLRNSALPGLRIQSDRTIASMASSQLDDADLALVAEHVGLLESTLLNGQDSEAMIVNVRDLLQLGLFTPRDATAEVQARALSLSRSTVEGQQGDDRVGVDGSITLRFTGLGGSESARLSFDLLTTALRDSGILLGEGNDRITITSGFSETPGAALRDPQQRGLRFDLGTLPESLGDGSTWSFNLNARAVGLDNSRLDLGGGDDSVSIMTWIDADPAGDLGILAADPHTHIQLQRVGMIDSQISMGDGNDQLIVNGDVVNSSLDLGRGDNTLILEGDIHPGSRILMGDGSNRVIVNSLLGGVVQGGDGADAFQLNNLMQAGELDGGGGQDTLLAPEGVAGRAEVLMLNQSNGGTLDGLRFRSIETVDLGGGNDIALIGLDGSLSGRLFGGDGLDRLEFNNWTLPVNVDLDRGSATAVGAGAPGALRGFEQVLGGLGSDTLSSSGAFAGIDGGEGDDLLFLRWSPWLTQGERRLQVRGGSGRDRVVISGLEEAPPSWWDGRSGLPDLVDLDQSRGASGSLGLTDTIAWLRREPLASGGFRETYQELTPSGAAGVGDARLLPIAPLEQLLAGMSGDTRQLAIAWDGQSEAQLVLLGNQGFGSSQAIANIPGSLGSQGWSTVSGSSGSTP